MNAKEYLKRIAVLDSAIDSKQAERQDVYERIQRITAQYKQDVSHGGNASGQHEDMLIRWIALKDEIDTATDKYIDARREAVEMLERLLFSGVKRAQEYYDVLHKRYILYEEWATIASEMNYKDVRSAHYLHGNALNAFQKILDAKVCDRYDGK